MDNRNFLRADVLMAATNYVKAQESFNAATTTDDYDPVEYESMRLEAADCYDTLALAVRRYEEQQADQAMRRAGLIR